jgi:(1->4)-alpha-D-glucan 1-alpha-D-glucosylmutase
MVPLATYRLQFNSHVRFRAAIPILDPLRDLGISHMHASPLLTSQYDSAHGYDVTDFTKIDSDLGGDEGVALFESALGQRGMGLILDIVPNPMAPKCGKSMADGRSGIWPGLSLRRLLIRGGSRSFLFLRSSQ